jgi:hypothetical protein
MSMDGSPTAGEPRFSVGGVISTALSVVFANLFRFLAVMLAIVAPVAALLFVLGTAMAKGMAADAPSTGAALQLPLNASQMLFFIIVFFTGLLAYFLVQAALAYGTLQTLRGRAAGIGACLSNALAAFPRIAIACLILVFAAAMAGVVAGLIASVLASVLGQGGGAVAMIAIGAGLLTVMVLIWVFVPALVVERAGPLASFSRSAALTKGHRWGILGILALVGVANWVISYVSRALTEIAPIAGPVIDIASGLFFMALGSVMAAVGYYYLRAEKEGVAIDDVVAVFD